MEKNKILRFGIIGAGPSGLTLAFALSKRENVHVTVFEKAPDHRNIPTFNPLRSYTIDITGHGARAVQYLNMKERFNKDLILFKGIRLPIINPKLEETYHGDGWTGSRGDIVKAIQEEIIEKTSGNVEIRFDTEANVKDAENGIISYENDTKTEMFDLIVGCDGAGSTVRNYLKANYKDFEVMSLDNDNYSMMLPFDKNTSELNPSYLYIFGMPPYLAVAGAINGKNGPSDPLWFCQIGYSGSRKFNSFLEAKSFLLKNYLSTGKNALTNYASDKAIEEFSKQENISTGRAKICSSFHRGKLVLLGDAASPFPPVGQGVNAAMEMAIILDGCIGEQLSRLNSSTKEEVISEAIKNFTVKWKPEADAIRTISFRGLNLRSFHPPLYGKLKTLWSVLLHKAFHRDPMTNAKRQDMSYSEALGYQKKVDLVLYGILGLTLCYTLIRILK
ncbi:MAG: FAD-dependent monooxygenase [Leptospiraceae bacterium]|nr:FAD-dependent monooxygenase [Leptospiraceae bacterium]